MHVKKSDFVGYCAFAWVRFYFSSLLAKILGVFICGGLPTRSSEGG